MQFLKLEEELYKLQIKKTAEEQAHYIKQIQETTSRETFENLYGAVNKSRPIISSNFYLEPPW